MRLANGRHLALLAALSTLAPAPALAQAERRTLTFANGDVFDGEMRDGLPNGPGSFTTRGHTYTGTWKDGCMSTPDGRRFAVGTTLDKCPPWRKPGFSRPDIK